MNKIVKAVDQIFNIGSSGEKCIQFSYGLIYKIRLLDSSPGTRFRLMIPFYNNTVYSNEYEDEILIENDDKLHELLETNDGVIGIRPEKFVHGIYVMVNRCTDDLFKLLNKISIDQYINITNNTNNGEYTHLQEVNFADVI